MARVIGIDFGNWQAYTCCLNGVDENTKLGGIHEDLIPGRYIAIAHGTGIPNEFFWGMVKADGKSKAAELRGFDLLERTVSPAENRLRLLKKHLGEEITLSAGKNSNLKKTYRYDDIITSMFEYHVGLANEALHERYGESGMTNLVSVAFPAKFRDPNMRQYFINLIEKADSGVRDKNGKMLKLRVVGFVCEPAAAGLDRLCEMAQSSSDLPENVTYGVFDLGGGTFDLSIVSLYPNGKKRQNGSVYYYDEVCDSGLNVAGSDFSNRLHELLVSKAKKALDADELTKKCQNEIAKAVESCKISLSNRDSAEVAISDPEDDDEEIVLTVTRKEFEQAISGEINRIIQFTTDFFNEHKDHRPDELVMTGGSSYIPCIQKRLEAALPAYKGKIFRHRPSTAAAYGAARFYNANYESINVKNSVGSGYTSALHRTVEFDLGVRVTDANDYYRIHTLITAGTEIPCDSGDHRFRTLVETTWTSYDLYRANKKFPDPKNVLGDYAVTREIALRYGREVPARTGTSCRLTIDDLGLIHLTAWEDDNTEIKVEETFSIDNNTDDLT